MDMFVVISASQLSRDLDVPPAQHLHGSSRALPSWRTPFMLFIANNMAQLNLSPDAFQYKKWWTTYGVFMLDFMLLVAVISTEWWDGKKKSIETAKRSDAQQSRRPWTTEGATTGTVGRMGRIGRRVKGS
jgi:hypothetical protein